MLATNRVKQQLVESGEVELFGADSKVWLGIPLITKGDVTGAFAVQSYTDENAYNEADVEMLEFIAKQISVSLDRKRAEFENSDSPGKKSQKNRIG